jgi:enoyl-CoA hydratase
MYSTLLTDITNHICVITINRPDRLNSLNKAVIEELSKAIDDVYNNSTIKSAIITGAGNRAFVAGADITEFRGLTKDEGMAMAKKGQDLFSKIENAPKPIIAAVNGFALGGGCELAMSCHFRVASENAKFGQPEVNLGLVPGYGGTQRLPQLIGKGRALELLMSGNLIDANTALQYGLVNHTTSVQELMNTAKSILETINTKAPLAVAKCITAVNAAYNVAASGYDTEIRAFGECFGTEDMKEGATAFLEKRNPHFSGK